ncbi:NADP-dependent oxidoreductase [Virgibacillus dokdonensis]|uniref:NADP-dependent oxidoreductase n=1 Tax=Virgibacillus dokdonensis TaxID=302167 RepID=A0A2K9J3M5_9BACI|nr:NADP-dependent oxidoreductase [Virgibacillus dokdonensis]AUJ25643.1 Zinc-type alcohol dehydrogenase-like protein [Virgibacillus dokdonensis]
MKAIVINQYGHANQLEERDVPKPQIKDNQVLVEMHATSINPIDWKVREGYLKEMLPLEFPIILGWDAAGIVQEVGSSVTKFKTGDRVFARPATSAQGTYAEYTAIDEDKVALLPDSITFNEAAAVPLAGLTAWQCLFDFGQVKAKDKVFIHAGSGGVGTYAIQFAKHFGAYVATTASEKNQELVESLGADRFINYKEEDFSEIIKDYDLVIDTIGGEVQEKSMHVLKEGGKLVSIVQPPNEDLAKELGITAGFLWLQENGKQLEEIAKLMENGHVKSIIGHNFPLTQEGVQQAHQLSETHHAKGKIIINTK